MVIVDKKFKLSSKLVAMVIVISSVVSLFTTASQLIWDYNVDVGKIDHTLDSIEVGYLGSLGKSVWSFDSSLINSTLDGIKNLNDIAHIRLELEEESFERGEVFAGRQVSRKFDVFDSGSGSGDKQNLGTLYVTASLENVYSRLYSRILIVLFFNILKTSIVSFLILFLFHRVVTRHLGVMVKYLEDYDFVTSTGSLNLRRDREPFSNVRDEIDQLAECIQDMSNRLADSREQIDSELAQRRGAEIQLRITNENLKKETLTAKKATESTKDFLAIMSHEIRNPLNSIIGLNSILLDTQVTDEQKGHLITIRNAGDSLRVIVNDVLDFSKIESGTFQVHNMPMNIHNCVRFVVGLFGEEARKRNVEIELVIGVDCPEFIDSDEFRIRQILTNLLSNSIRFSKDSRIIVRLEQGAQESAAGNTVNLQCSVEDFGPGISGDEISLLFVKYSQVGDARAKNGSGLGLLIARSLSRLLGGDVRVESELGRGSVFSFSLQAEVLPSLAGIAWGRSQLKSNLDLSELRVLVVDDCVTNRTINSAYLKRLGLRPDSAENGKIAVSMQQKNHYNIILMDIRMPVLGGVEAAELILKDKAEGERGPLIVAVTANAFPDDHNLYLEKGFAAVLSKPVSKKSIENIVEQYAGRSVS